MTAARPARRHSGGVSPARRQRRVDLEAWITAHMHAYPGTWFSAVELARAIAQQYLREPPPVSWGACHWGRSNVIMKVLRAKRDAGEVVSRPRASHAGATEWRIA